MECDQSSEVINNDVFYMKSLIGKKVRIQTIENECFEGVVYVIDPAYKTVVLIDNDKIRLFIYLSIKSIESLSDDIVEQSFLQEPKPKDIGNWKNIEERRDRLCKWLKHMYIKVEEEGELLKVEQYALIGPPYTEETCYCDNTVILERIRGIMSLMPKDFQ